MSDASQSHRKREVEKPGPGRPPMKDIEARNLQLIEKARDIFLEKGFEETTIAEIIEAVGMAKRTVWSRYGNKRALFKAAMENAVDGWVVPVETLKRAETGDMEETLLRVARILVANFLTPTGLSLLRITNAEASRSPEIVAYTVERGTRPSLEYLSDLFERRISNGGDLPNPAGYALSFMNLIYSPVRSIAWGTSLTEEMIDGHTKHCVRLFLHGIMHCADP